MQSARGASRGARTFVLSEPQLRATSMRALVPGWVACIMSPREGPIARQRAINARLQSQAAGIVERLGPDAVGARTLPVIMLPANTRDTEALPRVSREQFMSGLHRTIARVYEMPVRDNTGDMSEQESAARSDAVPDTSPVLGASCATCRGECCTAGGTHAFLRDDSLVRVRAQFAEDGMSLTQSELAERYARYLPVRHYRGSCVFHTTSACALPRSMRSNLCNRYVCGGLTQLTRALDATGAQSAYVAAADSSHLRRIARVSAGGAVAVSLKRADAT